jgi:hypothetical protein
MKKINILVIVSGVVTVVCMRYLRPHLSMVWRLVAAPAIGLAVYLLVDYVSRSVMGGRQGPRV